jgi:NADPH:quinone reductase-like Zn-dependent oxidoreductase
MLRRTDDKAIHCDAVLDLVGGETLARSCSVVKRGGIIVTFNQPPDPNECEKNGIQGFFVQTKASSVNTP